MPSAPNLALFSETTLTPILLTWKIRWASNNANRWQDLCLWFRATLIYINNCPTRCNTKQSIYYSASSLYMFRVSATPIISTQNCNYSLRYCSYLPATWPSLARLEGGRCTKNTTSTGGCSYSFVYFWRWLWLTPETCRVNLQNKK